MPFKKTKTPTKTNPATGMQRKSAQTMHPNQVSAKALNAPGELTGEQILALQQTAGNQATQRLLATPSQAVPHAAPTAHIQRTTWEWSGSEWKLHSHDEDDKDEHLSPDEVEFENLEPGDLYDQNTGELTSRAKKLRGRLGRAAERQEKRTKGKKRGHDEAMLDFSDKKKSHSSGDTRLQNTTPFGVVRTGRGAFTKQPYVNLDETEWPNRNDVPRTNYDILSQHIGASSKKAEILNAMETYLSSNGDVAASGLELPGKEKASSALLSGLLSVAEPHQLRNPAGGKPERASIRYARKNGMAKTYNRKNGAYVPAWAKAGGAPAGGTGAWREMRAGERHMPIPTLDLLDEMSESSSEEDEEAILPPPIKKARVSNEDEEK